MGKGRNGETGGLSRSGHLWLQLFAKLIGQAPGFGLGDYVKSPEVARIGLKKMVCCEFTEELCFFVIH